MAETVSDARLVDFATATNYVDVSVAEVIAMATELQLRRATDPAVAELAEALKAVTTDLSEFHLFCDDAKRPCGEYGVECPISMGEWIGESERATLVQAHALIAKYASPRDAT